MARTCATSYLEASEAQGSEVGTFVEFTRALRHELRDTLGSAFASARLLQDVGEKLPEPSRNEVLGSIPRNVQRAIDLLDGVCLLFGSESSWEDEPREKGLLEDVLPEAAENVSERERAAGVAVEVVGAIPACRVDAGRTRLILHNLVSNAVKYSDRSRDQPWVRLYVDPVEGEGGDVADEAEPGRVRIRVEDNGLGISPDEQERVFDPFYRGDAGDMSGSGLGLAIAREAARQMGGELTLESEPGRGSTFFVTVPTLRGPDEAVH